MQPVTVNQKPARKWWVETLARGEEGGSCVVDLTPMREVWFEDGTAKFFKALTEEQFYDFQGRGLETEVVPFDSFVDAYEFREQEIQKEMARNLNASADAESRKWERKQQEGLIVVWGSRRQVNFDGSLGYYFDQVGGFRRQS